MKAKNLLIGGISLFLALPAAAQSSKDDPLSLSTQILVVWAADWNAVEGVLQRYERADAHARWKGSGRPVTIVVGKNGMGWGTGVASTNGAGLRGPLDPVKKEGDGKSPAGVFRMSSAFGYAAEAPKDWKMPYIHLSQSMECVDDSSSRYYNQILDRSSVMPDWKSSEHMLRGDDFYRWGMVVDNNANPATAGNGSCIFMHVWSGRGQGTVGCTAMPQEQLEPILAWLDPGRNPLLVQLPAAQYRKLQKRWHLPGLPRMDPR